MTLRLFGHFQRDGHRIYMIFYAKDRPDLNKQLEDYAKHYNKDKNRTDKIIPFGHKDHSWFHVDDPRGNRGIVD